MEEKSMSIFTKTTDPTAKKIREFLALDESEARAEASALADLDASVRGLAAFERLNAAKLHRRGLRDELKALGHPMVEAPPTGLSTEALSIAMRVLVPIAVESGVPITPRTLLSFR
jgi:hypothetical protein